jgi:glycine/D-amino acid oxidase-like deaminating enzyme
VSVKRLYHDDLYRFAEPQPSWWEASAGDVRPAAEPLDRHESCEVAIIGGGYTGLSAALHLSERHGVGARVLEAGHIGWGSSGRNAGFCGIGGTSLSLSQMLGRYGLEETRRFYTSQVEAVELVRDLIASAGIEAETVGEAELEVAHSKRSFESLRRHADRQRELLGLDTRVMSAEEFGARYFDTTENYGAVVQRPCFALHPLRYHLGLAAAAVRGGATLHSHSEVIEWRKQGDTHTLVTAGGSLRCRHVIFATNGFMPEHLHTGFRGRPLPMISAIVVTRPLSDTELAAHRWQTANPAITSRNILNYYRLLPDKRFLFGGRGHSSGDREGSVRNYDELVRQLGHLFPHWRDVPIEYRWHGLICITFRLTPSIGRLSDDPSVFFAYGYHGNGVNTATWSGKLIADWLAAGGNRVPGSLPSMLRGLSPRFPVAPLRLGYLQARLALFRLQDAIA